MVHVDDPEIAADNNSESMDFAVPGSPTSSSPRSLMSVTTQRSINASSPKNFRCTSSLGSPRMKLRTARGDSPHPAGFDSLSFSVRRASSPAKVCSAGARRMAWFAVFISVLAFLLPLGVEARALGGDQAQV